MNTAAFLAKQIDHIEKELNVYSNTTKTTDRLSSGSLVFDWTSGGGLTLFSSIAGQEQSGKSTTCIHTIAEAIKLNLPYVCLWDAEGTTDIKYASSLWKPFGLDMQQLMDDPASGFRYYRYNVIERFFDYFVKILNHLPDKVWIPEENTWAYVIPKRNDYFAKLMSDWELKSNKKLSNEKQFICPTDDSRPQGFMCIDSFAAMLTNEDEENEEASNRRAKEASAFSMHLKRVIGKLPEKQLIMFGTNQLSETPGVTYGDPLREKGGNALKYYSSMRWRSFSRAVPQGYDRDKENGSICVEPSVEGSGVDRYMFKEIINTKNKLGRPGLKTKTRVWISDRKGKPHGVDPFFDVYTHLLNTKQITEKGSKITFNLRPSLKKLSEALNGTVTDYQTLKTLVIGEVTGRSDLISKAAKGMGISFNPKLRQNLFKQLLKDSGIHSDFVAEPTKERDGKKSKVDPEEL